MIVDGLLWVVFGLVNTLLLPLELLNITFDAVLIEPVMGFFKMTAYLLPVKELLPIVLLLIAIMRFRVIISLIKTIWDLLPVV